MKKFGLLFILLLSLAEYSPILALPLFVETKAGNKHFSQGEYNQAVSHYILALKQEPRSALLHFNLGAALYKQGKFQAADAEFKLALKLQATKQVDHQFLADTYYNLGNTSFMWHNYAEAITYYENALQSRPQDQQIKDNLELAKSMIKDQSNNQQNLQQAPASNSSSPQPALSPETAKRLLDALQQEQRNLPRANRQPRTKNLGQDW